MPELALKRLEWPRAAVPNARRIGLLWHAQYLEGTDIDGLLRAGEHLGIELIPFRPTLEHDYTDMQVASEAAREGHIDALFVAYQPIPNARTVMVELVKLRRLPAMFPSRDMAEAGGLLAYGPNLPEQFRL